MHKGKKIKTNEIKLFNWLDVSITTNEPCICSKNFAYFVNDADYMWDFARIIVWVVCESPLLMGSQRPMFNSCFLVHVMMHWQRPWFATPWWLCLFPRPQTWDMVYVHYIVKTHYVLTQSEACKTYIMR